MKFNFIYTTLLFIFVYSIHTYAQKISLLLRQPDMQEAFDLLSWEQNYEDSINKFLSTKNANNPLLNNVTVELTFYEYYPVNEDHTSEYLEFIKEVINYWGNSTVDMMILDDRLLFNDVALIECDSVGFYYNSRTPTRDHLVDMAPFINDRNELKFHDQRVFNDGILDEKIYGLPYEIDFDLLYYYRTNEKSNSIVDMMDKLSWDELILLSKFQSKDPFYMSLGDEDDLLNLFLEYTSNNYNLSKEYDESFFNIFYNGTSEHVLNSFKGFVNTYTDNNYNKTFMVSLDQVYQQFIDEKIMFFRGKASHSRHFKVLSDFYNKTIASSLPPKFTSTLTEKYIVLNKHSRIDPKILTEVALQLTSKEMQMIRAQELGRIPTFDINLKDDEVVGSFCSDLNFQDICQKLRLVNKIYMKDVFQSKYSPPLFETRLLLPSQIKKFIYNVNTLQQTIFTFKNIKELSTTDIQLYINFIYVFMGLGILYSLYTMYYVYKFRQHPYMKVISPSFCIIIIFGYILSMVEPTMIMPPYFILKCKFLSIYDIFTTSLILLPMFVVTYRIYHIFKNESTTTMKLNNKRLSIFIIIVILILLVYKCIIFLYDEHYYMAYGYISQSRLPYCYNEHYVVVDRIDDIYLCFTVSIKYFISIYIIIIIISIVYIYIYIYTIFF